MDPFLRYWVGAEFASHAAIIAQILLVGAWSNGVASIPYALLQGQRRPDLAAKIHMVEVLPFLGGLYLLIVHFGLPGAALAWTLRTIIDCIAMLLTARCWTANLLRSLPAIALIAGSCLIARILPPSLILCAIAAVAVGIAFVACAAVLDPTSRERLRALSPRRQEIQVHTS
jgi:O-antigen/teichoic acid export membrane protein